MPSRCLFALLESLNHDIEDTLDIMSLVNGEKPIRAYVRKINLTLNNESGLNYTNYIVRSLSFFNLLSIAISIKTTPITRYHSILRIGSVKIPSTSPDRCKAEL